MTPSALEHRDLALMARMARLVLSNLANNAEPGDDEAEVLTAAAEVADDLAREHSETAMWLVVAGEVR